MKHQSFSLWKETLNYASSGGETEPSPPPRLPPAPPRRPLAAPHSLCQTVNQVTQRLPPPPPHPHLHHQKQQLHFESPFISCCIVPQSAREEETVCSVKNTETRARQEEPCAPPTAHRLTRERTTHDIIINIILRK